MPLVKKAPTPKVKPAPLPEGVGETNQTSYDEPVATGDTLVDGIIEDSPERRQLEPNKYEAIVNRISVMPPRDKGVFIIAEFIIAAPEYQGFKHSTMFRMTGADCRTADEWGPTFYNALMGKLGYEKGNRGKEAREAINQEKPAVILKITQSKQQGYVNTSIDGLLDEDNETIQALREYLQSTDPIN